MATDMEPLYQQRLKRYVTAMRNGKPDMVPIRPFVAEFTAKYAGYTNQQVCQDYELAFAAARKCAADFDWDAVVANMVYGWMGFAQALDLKYYAVPGVHISHTSAFQYLEPSEEDAWMKPEEYDGFIADPIGFLWNVWLPRVAREVPGPDRQATYRGNVSLVKSGMGMLNYFHGFGTQAARLRNESGTVSAIAGILKAPFDILADKFRGYIGLTMDLFERREKVLKACEALMPHLLWMALSGADPDKNVPISIWMHRGCVPFINPEQFKNLYWATLKPIIEEIWRRGHQVLFYAEGKWGAHLQAFRELPEGSIIYHCDQDDIFQVHRELHDKFAISGGTVPNYMLQISTPQQVREYVKKVIQGVARDGGYIADACAIVQDDAKVENIKAMTDAVREYGQY